MRKILTYVLSACVAGGGLAALPVIAGAVSGQRVSAQSEEAITPPFSSDFLGSDLDGWTVIDVNNDGCTWAAHSEGVRATYSSSNVMDDWLISPALQLEAGKIYEVSYEAKCNMSSYPERMEVKYGRSNTVDGMTETLLEPRVIANTEFQSFNHIIIPEESGVYYIGFHGISDANMYYLLVNNVRVSAGVSGDSPGEASNLQLAADPLGAFKCTVTFTTPATTYSKGVLTSLTEVEVLRDGEVVKIFTAPGIGVEVSFEDVLEDGGVITYSVIGKNEHGAGPAISADVFVGFDRPVDLTAAELTRTDFEGGVKVTWEPVTEDINGMPLTVNDVFYRLYRITDRDYYGKPNLRADNVLVENLKGSSYEGKLLEEGDQQFVELAVVPYNSGGEGGYALTDKIVIGTPHVEFNESFSDLKTTHAVMYGTENGGSATLSNSEWSGPQPQDDDSGMLKIYTPYSDCYAYLITGYLDVDDLVNPTLSFYLNNNIEGYYENPNENLVSVWILPLDGEDWIEISSPAEVRSYFEEGNKGVWGQVMVAIPAEYTDGFFQLQIKIESNGDNSYTYLDNISVVSLQDYDLALTGISSAAVVKTGESYDVTVGVKNMGYSKADAFVVELYGDGLVIDTKEVTDLPSQKTETLTFNVTMSAIATSPVAHYAKLVYAEDMDESNNETDLIEVAPKVSTLPVAENFTAETSETGVSLSWTAPDLANMVAEPVTEGFENGQAGDTFYEGWTFVDKDGARVSIMNGTGDLFNQVITGSFFVLDIENEQWDHDERFDPHGGTHFIFSTFHSGGALGDDWAISPVLSGEAQTISFWAKSSSSYSSGLEQIEVRYSTGSLETDDFIEMPETLVAEVPQEWTEYTVDLPAGAQYFAIRSFGKNAYQLLIDDVTYAPESPSNFEIIGFNIYRDGELVNETPITGKEFVDEDAPEGDHVYHVTVVYKDRGESTGSSAEITVGETNSVGAVEGNAAIYTLAGNIVIVNAEGLETTVASVNGSVLFSGMASAKTVVPADKGIYLVKIGNSARKVVVK